MVKSITGVRLVNQATEIVSLLEARLDHPLYLVAREWLDVLGQ